MVARSRRESNVIATCIPKIHSIFFIVISNFSKEIIYKIVQIKIVKRTINLLNIQYFFPMT